MPPVSPNGHGMGMTRGSVDMAGTLTYLSMSATAPRACTWYIRNVEVCSVEGRTFLDVASQWPQALLELALRLGVRVREGEEQLGRMTATGSRARLAAALYRLARNGSETQPGGGLRLRGVPRHTELASEIGATRETVTRMLARLEQDGYIRRFGRQIVVPDVERLADDFDLRA